MTTKDTECDGRWENRTGLTFAIDSHIVDGETPAEIELRRLHTDGWIELVLTDETRAEWLAAKPGRRQELEALAINYIQYWGALTLDHSRLDRSVLGTPEDQERLEGVFAALWPNKLPKQARRQDVRDAMNVALAIRYGLNGFITRDGAGRDRGVLDRADAIAAAFNGFSVMSPERALAFVERTIRGRQVRNSSAS